MGERIISSVSHSISEQEIGDFWDTHDFTEFDDSSAPDVSFEISDAPVSLSETPTE